MAEQRLLYMSVNMGFWLFNKHNVQNLMISPGIKFNHFESHIYYIQMT